ncbi:hypothetical protein ACWDZ5_32920, partial [Streptomyces sp. NPDC002996]
MPSSWAGSVTHVRNERGFMPLCSATAAFWTGHVGRQVLAFTAQPCPSRLRIAWTCDGTSLTIDVREHESGNVDTHTLACQLEGRARALGATVDLDAVADWGSRASISLPL